MSNVEMQDYQWLACLPQVLDFENKYLDVYLQEKLDAEQCYVEMTEEEFLEAS